MRTISGDGFTLEPQVAGHAEAMFALLQDPAIYTYENEPPESVESLRRRFARLESRRSGDGREHWLNWVIRLPDGSLAGYVQATVHPDGPASIAYVLNSMHWGHGLATRAVRAMLDELQASFGVTRFVAVFKRDNLRSRRLLERIGFAVDQAAPGEIEPDEHRMALNA